MFQVIRKTMVQRLLVSMVFVPCLIFSEQTVQKETPKYTPENAVVAFDVHNVLVSLNKSDLLRKLYNFSDKWNLALLVCNPCLWKRVYEIRKRTHCVQSIFDSLSQKYPILKQDTFKKLFYSLANSQDPIKPMISFVDQLKKKGFSLYIASNIGYSVWSDLVKKYPKFKELFGKSNDKSHVLCAHPIKESGKVVAYVEKPQPEFFTELCALVNKKDKDKNIVFIDDKQKNIDAAEKNKALNIAGLLFDPKKVNDEISLYNDSFGLSGTVAPAEA